MKNSILWLLFLAMIQSSCNMGQDHRHTNKLIDETSPYLLQHAHNPVNWQPWGAEALNEAKENNKLLIVSIGYAACHWCHVMEHESFENDTIAQKMNENFVSIKVDREERPDIDQIYMDAAQLMLGSGGWPLNIIALPDGRPVYAVTYAPKAQWEQILDHWTKVYSEQEDRVKEHAAQVTAGIQQLEIPELNKSDDFYNPDTLAVVRENFLKLIDFRHGGRQSSSNKFPMPSAYESLLVLNYFNLESDTEEALKITLDNIANGGIYDHLGGGFARYSTDPRWIVPHFEKMLYDNAQLISLYSHAYQVFGDEKYKQAVEETIEFCQRELMDESGGFYSSLDADSEGVEGKFYVWTEEEIDQTLGSDTEIFKEYYGVTKRGNFEHQNILVRSSTISSLALKYDLTEEETLKIINNSKIKLFEVRSSRIRPGLDDKVLTSWNGLMIAGLVDAYFTFQKDEYLEQGLKTGAFLRDSLIQDDGTLLRNYKNGKTTINGFLDDYASTILGFIKLYEATFDESWLYQAKELKEYVDEHFSDPETQMYFYTSDLDEKLIARKMELSDNVIPASNSAMAEVLFKLGQYFYNEKDIDRAKQMVLNSQANFTAYPHYYSNWARLYTLMGNSHFEVAVVGPEANTLRSALSKEFIPNKILLGGENEGTLELLKGKLSEGDTYIYVCTNKSCKLPVKEAEKAIAQIN